MKPKSYLPQVSYDIIDRIYADMNTDCFEYQRSLLLIRDTIQAENPGIFALHDLHLSKYKQYGGEFDILAPSLVVYRAFDEMAFKEGFTTGYVGFTPSGLAVLPELHAKELVDQHLMRKSDSSYYTMIDELVDDFSKKFQDLYALAVDVYADSACTVNDLDEKGFSADQKNLIQEKLGFTYLALKDAYELAFQTSSPFVPTQRYVRRSLYLS